MGGTARAGRSAGNQFSTPSCHFHNPKSASQVTRWRLVKVGPGGVDCHRRFAPSQQSTGGRSPAESRSRAGAARTDLSERNLKLHPSSRRRRSAQGSKPKTPPPPRAANCGVRSPWRRLPQPVRTWPAGHRGMTTLRTLEPWRDLCRLPDPSLSANRGSAFPTASLSSQPHFPSLQPPVNLHMSQNIDTEPECANPGTEP